MCACLSATRDRGECPQIKTDNYKVENRWYYARVVFLCKF